MSEHSSPQSGLPTPRVTRKARRSIGWVWLVPVVAALVGLSIVWHAWSRQGPKITISFQTASGLEAGKTQIRYRDVVIGTVKDIRLSEKRDAVLVDAELSKDAEALANEGTSFWAVKPRIGYGGVSGISTLFSGVYIAADTDVTDLSAKAKKRRFIGLESPPPIHNDRPGTRFLLTSPDLASLGAGAPVYYRRIQVGMVTAYKLDALGNHVDLEVFIDAPYDKFVDASTRFWNESGIDISVGADGVKVSTQSVATILAGGLAFGSFGSNRDPLPTGQVFKLFESRSAAALVPEGVALPVVMRFYQNARGLKVGSPIDFAGTDLGIINKVDLDFDPKLAKFYTRVEATLYPERLGPIYSQILMNNQSTEQWAATLVRMSMRGLRAELRTANLLTGQLYIALEELPKAAKLDPPPKAVFPFEIATVVSDDLNKIQAHLANIASRLDKIPYEEIGQELNGMLKQVKLLSASLDKNVVPNLAASLAQFEKTFKNLDALVAPGSPLPADTEQVLDDMKRALQSLRGLTDALQKQPDSVILGRKTQSYSRENLGATK